MRRLQVAAVFLSFFFVERALHIAVQQKELDYRSHSRPSGKIGIK